MFSGAYPCTLVDDVVFCVEGKMINKGADLAGLGIEANSGTYWSLLSITFS